MNATSRLLDYHERTKHSSESVRSSAHFLDWDNEPSRFKEYLDLEPEPLPTFRSTGVPSHRAVRSSARPDGTSSLDLETLSYLLHHAAGVSRTLRTSIGKFHFRTYASAGALYPVEAYVVAGEVDGLHPGVYHYAPREHGLRRLRSGEFRGSLGLAGGMPGAAAIVLSGLPWRTAWKYTARGFRHLYWDAGMMVANLLAAATARRVQARLFLGFVDRVADGLLGLDGRAEFALCIVALGRGRARAQDDAPSLTLRSAPVSARPLSDPAIEEAREAVALGSDEEVRDFRQRVPHFDHGEGIGVQEIPSLQEDALSSDGFEEVVARRGSSRHLAGEAFPAAEYAAILDGALARLPADWSSGEIRPLVVASALEGLAPGAYSYDPGGRFHLVREGRFRAQAAHLCLDQRLGGDAAAVTFLMADLDAHLGVLGGRGYAAAQLGSAVAAGRMYLGAYAQCLGASGITFYDDEVRTFFGTTADPMLAVVMGPEGRRRSIRRCRRGRSATA